MSEKWCRKKYFESARWLQWIKNKKYPLWRIDILFSKKKYNDKQNSNIQKILNSVDYYSDRSEDSDTERELYRYRVDPNSIYMQ